MVEIRNLIYSNKFERDFKKIKDNSMKDRLRKQIQKLADNPESGKPLRYGLKGERAVRIKPYRMIHTIQDDNLILLRFEHRK
jgi:mRNA-degrading endonuclease RelE of RelBE toxin-antitoxin system